MQKQHSMYFDYNDTSVCYINSNMELLRVRKHQMIIYNKVLDNRARLAYRTSTYDIACYNEVYSGRNMRLFYLLPTIYENFERLLPVKCNIEILVGV